TPYLLSVHIAMSITRKSIINVLPCTLQLWRLQYFQNCRIRHYHRDSTFVRIVSVLGGIAFECSGRVPMTKHQSDETHLRIQSERATGQSGDHSLGDVTRRPLELAQAAGEVERR